MGRIHNLDDIPKEKSFFPFKNLKFNFLPENRDGREINIYKLLDSIVIGESNFYPNPLLYSFYDKKIYNPINERIMSLIAQETNKEFNFTLNTKLKYNVREENFFFFIYNTDNYFHFLYDTLPYLITYLKLRSIVPGLKLLMNYPNRDKNEFYKFVLEFLEILDIKQDDIEIVEKNSIYKSIYISSSYTHGINSNLPPREEIFDFYKFLTEKTVKFYKTNKELPKKIYISRRTWKNPDSSNIGTDYTSKRKLVNEDELVSYLENKGFVEIFTENLSTVEKILLFNNAEHVVGAIGGGISNVLFSKKDCKLTAILSPHFLTINKRFQYTLQRVNLDYFTETKHDSDDEWKKYMRIKSIKENIIGEIIDIEDDVITVEYSDEPIAGWNNKSKFKIIKLNKKDCIRLDEGLNSPWLIDMNKFKIN